MLVLFKIGRAAYVKRQEMNDVAPFHPRDQKLVIVSSQIVRIAEFQVYRTRKMPLDQQSVDQMRSYLPACTENQMFHVSDLTS